MRSIRSSCLGLFIAGVLTSVLASVLTTAAYAQECPSDTVEVGFLCVDRYEASVWSQADGTGTQFGTSSANYPCSENGNDCAGQIYAASTAGVVPSQYISWFQAQQACLNAGKRLLTSAEWQMAAAGTPDAGDPPGADDCNTDSLASAPSLSGERSDCRSNFGAYDMVGNVWEWVADWIQDKSDVDDGSISSAAYGEDGIFGVDEASPTEHRFPAAILRGGRYTNGTGAGVFAYDAVVGPARVRDLWGFRCGRQK